MLNGVGTELTAAGARENNLAPCRAWFIEPDLQYSGNRPTKWNGALFATFADDLQIRSLAECQILSGKSGHFGQAQSGLNGQ